MTSSIRSPDKNPYISFTNFARLILGICPSSACFACTIALTLSPVSCIDSFISPSVHDVKHYKSIYRNCFSFTLRVIFSINNGILWNSPFLPVGEWLETISEYWVSHLLIWPYSKFISTRFGKVKTPTTGKWENWFYYHPPIVFNFALSGFEIFTIEDNESGTIFR